MKAGNLLVKSLGENVDLATAVLAGVLLLPELKLGKSLVGERGGHDERWVASGTSQVEKTSLGKDDDTLSGLELEAVDLGLDVDTLGGLHQSIHIDFVVEVTNVSDNGVVLHLGHGVAHEDSLVSGGGDEDVGEVDNILKSGDGESLHAGLKGADGVDLGDVDDTSASTHGGGTSLADISVSADDGLLSGHHDISGTHDTIRERVLASVKVVELGLGDRVVDVDGGEEEGAGLLHGVQTVDTGGSLLRDTHASFGDLAPLVGLTSLEQTLDDGEDNLELGVVGGAGVGEGSVLEEGVLGLLSLVDEESHVSTVIDDKVRALALAIVLGPGEGIEGALPVFLEGLSLPCKDGGGLVTSDSGGGVVLGGEDVARAPTDVSTEVLEGLDQDGGLDGHVEGSRDTSGAEGLGGSEFLTARHETRHLNLSQLNVLAAVIGKGNIGNCKTKDALLGAKMTEKVKTTTPTDRIRSS